jgi:hypothetical protein
MYTNSNACTVPEAATHCWPRACTQATASCPARHQPDHSRCGLNPEAQQAHEHTWQPHEHTWQAHAHSIQHLNTCQLLHQDVHIWAQHRSSPASSHTAGLLRLLAHCRGHTYMCLGRSGSFKAMATSFGPLRPWLPWLAWLAWPWVASRALPLAVPLLCGSAPLAACLLLLRYCCCGHVDHLCT